MNIIRQHWVLVALIVAFAILACVYRSALDGWGGVILMATANFFAGMLTGSILRRAR